MIKTTSPLFAYPKNCVERLLDLIHITEYLSTRIHGLRSHDEIYATLEKKFRQSKKYNCAVLILNSDKTGMRIVSYSQPIPLIHTAEKYCGVKINDFFFTVKKTSHFGKVVFNNETINIKVNVMLKEMFPAPLRSVMGIIFNITRKMCIITPLRLRSECIGVFVMSSRGLVDYLIPSVRYFAENISIALEFADETQQREKTQKSLREKNIALKEILNQIESEKRSIEHNVILNIEKTVLPLLDKLKLHANSIDKEYLKLIESSLIDITSPFQNKLSGKHKKLTQREIEICNFIRKGLTSKEIARLLNISNLTVNRHREYIRKKLGIANTDVSIHSYLNSDYFN